MSRLTLALRELKESLNPIAIISGKDRVDIRAAGRAVRKSEKASKEAEKEKHILIQIVKKGERDTFLKEFQKFCNDFKIQIDIDAEAMAKLIQMSRREFLELKKINQNIDSNSPDKRELISAMLKFQKKTEIWFDRLQKRNSLALYMSDEISLKQEIEHLADPFNLQRDVKRLRGAFAKALVKARETKKPFELSKRGNIARDMHEALETVNQTLDKEFEKLDLMWRNMINLMQLEIMHFQKDSQDLLVTLTNEGFPENDLYLMKKMIQETNNYFEKDGKDVVSQLNSLIIIERTA